MLADPDDEKLKQRGLKRINFLHHNYFMLFRVENENAIIVRVFHGLEDYQNKLWWIIAWLEPGFSYSDAKNFGQRMDASL